ncbi:hypothetical protein AVEN_136873-1 [Araneus ventricosus]|uniref:Uncharacterized protein n=1 Tax=Araneus ventricosus TaxID=182803 RepID=A0A4Y2UD35_ARAVE|nr:hypothetical protein AVEN_136873-1 [Araneus ventricosus]
MYRIVFYDSYCQREICNGIACIAHVNKKPTHNRKKKERSGEEFTLTPFPAFDEATDQHEDLSIGREGQSYNRDERFDNHPPPFLHPSHPPHPHQGRISPDFQEAVEKFSFPEVESFGAVKFWQNDKGGVASTSSCSRATGERVEAGVFLPGWWMFVASQHPFTRQPNRRR